MSYIDSTTSTLNWPPPRKRQKTDPAPEGSENVALIPTPRQSVRNPATPARFGSHRLANVLPTPSPTPRPSLPEKRQRVLRRNGYEIQPKLPSYQPYALNNKGRPLQQAFNFEGCIKISPLGSLSVEQWNRAAVDAGLLREGAELRRFQVEVANCVIGRQGDACLVAPTGSGKSLVWVLPLLAQKRGISLVVVPYTSLGLQGEGRYEGTKIKSTFLQSAESLNATLAQIGMGDGMRVVYACPEMLETPRVAKLLHSEAFRAQLSGIYIDEAHSVHESHSWRPAYAHLNRLRRVVGLEAPLVCLSATLPKSYRNSLEIYAGLKLEYQLINLGNFRPELCLVVKEMDHDISSFEDLGFVVPWNATPGSIEPTLIYTDDIARLTDMFWYFHILLSSRGLPVSLLDIMHAGLSTTHQEKATKSFMAGDTKILLATDKIGAGMDFPDVRRVVQFCCQDLTLVRWEQRRGRGARREGKQAVGIILVEKSMTAGDGRVSVTSPGFEDPGLVELVQSADCLESVTDLWLENPFRGSRTSPCGRCSNCNPELLQVFCSNLTWIMENPEQSLTLNPSTRALPVPSKNQKEVVLNYLREWRRRLFEKDWSDWVFYGGPDTIVSDADLDEIASHIHVINTTDQLFARTHILHFEDIAPSLLQALAEIKINIYGRSTIAAQATKEPENAPPFPEMQSPLPISNSFSAIGWALNATGATESSMPKTRQPQKGRLAPGEFVIDFNVGN